MEQSRSKTPNQSPATVESRWLAALQRAEFLMRRASQGDHQAFGKLADAAAECRSILAELGAAEDAGEDDDQAA